MKIKHLFFGIGGALLLLALGQVVAAQQPARIPLRAHPETQPVAPRPEAVGSQQPQQPIDRPTLGVDAENSNNPTKRATAAIFTALAEMNQRRDALQRAQLAYAGAQVGTAEHFEAKARGHRAQAETSASEANTLGLFIRFLDLVAEAIQKALQATPENSQLPAALEDAQATCGAAADCRRTLPELYRFLNSAPSHGEGVVDRAQAKLAEIRAARSQAQAGRAEAARQRAASIALAERADRSGTLVKAIEAAGDINPLGLPGGVSQFHDLANGRR